MMFPGYRSVEVTCLVEDRHRKNRYDHKYRDGLREQIQKIELWWGGPENGKQRHEDLAVSLSF